MSARKTGKRSPIPVFPQQSEELPVPVFNGFVLSQDEGSEHDQQEHEGRDDKLQEMVSESKASSSDTKQSSAPQQFSQPELNDLVCDLGLSKSIWDLGLLASTLQEKNLLDHSANVSYFRKRDQVFVAFFSEDKQFVYCHDIPGLLRQLGVTSYNPTE